MSKLGLLINFITFSTMTAAAAFMALVFWVEMRGGQITYYEPNRTIAILEFVLVIFGAFVFIIRSLSWFGSSKIEPQQENQQINKQRARYIE